MTPTLAASQNCQQKALDLSPLVRPLKVYKTIVNIRWCFRLPFGVSCWWLVSRLCFLFWSGFLSLVLWKQNCEHQVCCICHVLSSNSSPDFQHSNCNHLSLFPIESLHVPWVFFISFFYYYYYFFQICDIKKLAIFFCKKICQN
jgi:hypothetical protein